MANSPEDPSINSPDPTELNLDDDPNVLPQSNRDEEQSADDEETPYPIGSDRSEEIPVLLGSTDGSVDDEPEIAPDQDDAPDDTTDADDGHKASSASNSFFDQPVKPQTAANTELSSNSTAEHYALGVDLKFVLESMQDSLDNTKYISSKLDAVSSDTDNLVKQVNNVSNICQILTAEIESISSGTHTKSILSKSFLTISSAIVALLVIFQIYMFSSLVKVQRMQNLTGSSVLQNISGLNKKMVAYDNNLTKAIESSAQKEHAQPHPAITENAGGQAHENGAVNQTNAAPVIEKLNKLRNGLTEKQLIRKETGDWFVLNKKSEEIISDVDIINALNQAYKEIGRTLTPRIPMPAHKALCVLKPDGKGGTEVVMSKTFVQ